MTALVTVLLALYIFLSVSVSIHKCTSFDEIAHLTAGYSYWKNDDFRLQPENGVFPQYWTAIPLLFGNYKFALCPKRFAILFHREQDCIF